LTVLDKNQAAAFFQNTSDFLERSSRFGNGAQRPCDHRSVDRVIRERKAFFRGLGQELNPARIDLLPFPGYLLQLNRWIDAIDVRDSDE
jgi:hypothetical protein